MAKLPFHITPTPALSANWEDLRAVASLVASVTLTAAGEALAVNYTTVARRIRRAEEALGETLFERLADGYAPTEAALLVAEHVRRMADEDHALMRKLAGKERGLTGCLTITAPQLLIAHVMAPALQEFKEAFPDLELRIKATNEKLDLTRREADIGIRISPEPGDTLKGLRLVEQNTASFATQDWADRIAAKTQEPIDWVIYEGHAGLPKQVAERSPSSRVQFRFDDMVALAGAAQAGLGVARLPMFLGRSLSGLVQVPLLDPTPYLPIWIVAHEDVWKSAKVAAFRKIMARGLKDARAVFVA